MGTTEAIAQRVATTLGDPELVARLARLPPSELTSLLLAVHRAQAERRTFTDVRKLHERAAMFHVSAADPRVLAGAERAFHEALAAFAIEPVELSPIAPLGLAALTGIDPNNALAALRSAEVLADPTAAMALEVAARRRRERATVALGTQATVLRMQPLPKAPGMSAHFRMQAIVSSCRGRDEERAELLRHLRAWLVVLQSLATLGFRTVPARVELTHLVEGVARVADEEWRARVLEPALAATLPGVTIAVDDARTQGRGYYQRWMLKLRVRSGDEWLDVGDGGFVGWMGALVGDAREALMTSGFGVERIVKQLGPARPA